jgi:Mycothiol-dependent nitroreductase Rv2466c
MADLEFFFDPVCPWAWVTSRWVVEVADQRGYEVDWRFICLRIVNEDKDFEQDPTSPYGRVHGAGRMMLRAAAAAKVSAGNDGVARLYTELGNRLHLQGRSASEIREGNFSLIEEAIDAAGLGSEVATAADDQKWDDVLREETAVALGRTGNDVGTPIITFSPGTIEEASFFGPVLNRIPRGAEATEIWDTVERLARVPGLFELKRTNRGRPDFS